MSNEPCKLSTMSRIVLQCFYVLSDGYLTLDQKKIKQAVFQLMTQGGNISLKQSFCDPKNNEEAWVSDCFK